MRVCSTGLANCPTARAFTCRWQISVLRVINLGIRFLLELCALAVACYWGATLRAGGATRLLFAELLPVTVAALWALFISPKATWPAGRHGQAGLGLLVFLLAAGALAHRGHPLMALVLAAVATTSSLLLYLPAHTDAS